MQADTQANYASAALAALVRRVTLELLVFRAKSVSQFLLSS